MDTIRIRASSLPSAMDCAMRWKAELDGERLPGNGYTQIGTAVHASTAEYDREVMASGKGNISDTADLAVEALKNPEEEVNWEGFNMDFAIEVTVSAHVNYCNHIAPKFKYASVEHTLTNAIVRLDDDICFELTGTLDRVYENDLGQYGIADIKTGKAIIDTSGEVKKQKHLPQLGEYELLAELELGRPLEAPAMILGLSTSGNGSYGIGEVHNAKEALIGNEFQPGLLQFVGSMFKTGLFPPNPSSMLCSNKYCPIYHKCPYHG